MFDGLFNAFGQIGAAMVGRPGVGGGSRKEKSLRKSIKFNVETLSQIEKSKSRNKYIVQNNLLDLVDRQVTKLHHLEDVREPARYWGMIFASLLLLAGVAILGYWLIFVLILYIWIDVVLWITLIPVILFLLYALGMATFSRNFVLDQRESISYRLRLKKSNPELSRKEISKKVKNRKNEMQD
jgi:hypothetical protein